MRKYLLPIFYIGPLVLWMGVIFMGSTHAGSSQHSYGLLRRLIELLWPYQATTFSETAYNSINFVVRKIMHVTEYAVLTLLSVRAIQFGAERLKPKAFIGALLLSTLYASSDEIHQRFVPGRTSSAEDVLIDACGIVFVLVSVLFWFGFKSLERWLWRNVNPAAPPLSASAKADTTGSSLKEGTHDVS